MNYRHAFHAGNFADIHKHFVLLALLDHLHKKPAAFFAIDTHAGRGVYDLTSKDAQRGAEWRQGIELFRQRAGDDFQRFLSIVQAAPNYYHGSPLIIASLLRDGDRAVFVERQAEEAAALLAAVGKRRRVSVLNDDGYATLKAHLPPRENRGLVLIDPPYESDAEFQAVAWALQASLMRWPNGIYCIWYPLTASRDEQRFHRSLIDTGIKKMLLLELSIRPPDSPLGLNGSGVLVVNPPWQLDRQMHDLLSQIHAILAPDNSGGVRIAWLAEE